MKSFVNCEKKILFPSLQEKVVKTMTSNHYYLVIYHKKYKTIGISDSEPIFVN